MKTVTLFTAIVMFAFHLGWAQTKTPVQGPLTFGSAPAFAASSTTGNINFPDDFYGKWKILFSHPADFTPVCTSEIIALAESQDEFKKLNTALIVISTDGLNSHIEWVKSMESINTDGKDNVKINFPLVTDGDLRISKMYGILNHDSASSRDIRGVFIIDPDNKIRSFMYYPKAVGRNIEEIKRILIALQTEDKYDVLTPAGWKPGQEVLIKSPATMKEAEKLKAKNDPDLRQVTWYLWYKRLKM